MTDYIVHFFDQLLVFSHTCNMNSISLILIVLLLHASHSLVGSSIAFFDVNTVGEETRIRDNAARACK